MALCKLPAEPQNSHLLSGHLILSRASLSAQSFFDAFTKIRTYRRAKGTPTDHEQDLLRAALIFASAGLDSMVKQLVRDALPHVLQKDHGAQLQFGDFIQTRLKRSDPIDLKYLANALAARDMRVHLRDEMVRELTSASLQSKDQLFKVAAYFAISADEITNDANTLKTVFDARNQIAHEMDVDFTRKNRSRRSRSNETITKYTTVILGTAVSFYSAVQKKL